MFKAHVKPYACLLTNLGSKHTATIKKKLLKVKEFKALNVCTGEFYEQLRTMAALAEVPVSVPRTHMKA